MSSPGGLGKYRIGTMFVALLENGPAVVKRGIFAQRKDYGEKIQSAKNENSREYFMVGLCPAFERKKFHNRCSQLLWRTLWRMWKTPVYSQVFRLFRKNTGLWRKKTDSVQKIAKAGKAANGVWCA